MSEQPIQITRRLEIDAGHRLMRHESKCRNVHGHRYAFEVTVEGPGLDEVGRVIDFGVVKEKVGGWLNDTFDHGMIVEDGDPIIPWLANHDQKTVVLDCAPSIENLVRIVFEKCAELLPEPLRIVHVRGYETPTCWADIYEELRIMVSDGSVE